MKDTVGPVLETSDVGRAVVAAIQRENPDVKVEDRGSYVRVRAPGKCQVTRAAIEQELGKPFALPADLEQVMPSFAGRISFTRDTVAWTWARLA